MSSCTPGYREIAEGLRGGLDCATAPPLVSVHLPWTLAHWTMPVLELLFVLGAGAALAHAVLAWRRRRDPVNLAVWAASVVYVLLLEPPLYFPDRFGLQDQLSLIFVHNQFSVQFLYDRLPLYIVALYPALTYLAVTLVRSTGVTARSRPWVGAACVAVTFHLFYEIFDQLGPQLLWWAWNPQAPTNTPLLGSAPLSSAVVFAGASPFGFALLTQLLIVRRAERGPVPGWSLAARIVAVGALTPLFMVLLALPFGAVDAIIADPPEALRAAALWLSLVPMFVIAGITFGRQWNARTPRPAPDRGVVIGAGVYLVAFAALWLASLPEHLAADSGRTADGALTGHLGYVLLCFAGSAAVLLLAARTRPDTGAANHPLPETLHS